MHHIEPPYLVEVTCLSLPSMLNKNIMIVKGLISGVIQQQKGLIGLLINISNSLK